MVDFAFLDSGTGGIPYMLALKEKYPQSKCVYLGDTAHFPYGEKSFNQVIECAGKAIQLIIDKWNPKTVVIACNTISVTALESLRKIFPDLPIVGTVPAVKLAAKVTKNKKIGLLATNATVNHPYCQNLIREYASDCQVFSRGDPVLIDFIEKNLFTASDQEKTQAVKPAVDYFKEKGCDTIILGCTHFTHMAKIVSDYAGTEIQVIDSRQGVVNQAIKVDGLNARESLSKADVKDQTEDMSFFVTKADSVQEEEYKILCKNLNILWKGIIGQ